MKKQGKMERRMVIFLVVVAIIVIATVAIIISNSNKKNEQKVEQDQTNSTLEAEVNPDSTPEENPSIGGTDNVKEENGLKVNTSNKLKETKTFGIYTLENISVIKGETGTAITGTLTANVTEKTAGRDAVMKFYDKNGKLLSQMNTYIPQVKPNESVTFSTETTADVANAYDFTIEF